VVQSQRAQWITRAALIEFTAAAIGAAVVVGSMVIASMPPARLDDASSESLRTKSDRLHISRESPQYPRDDRLDGQNTSDNPADRSVSLRPDEGDGPSDNPTQQSEATPTEPVPVATVAAAPIEPAMPPAPSVEQVPAVQAPANIPKRTLNRRAHPPAEKMKKTHIARAHRDVCVAHGWWHGQRISWKCIQL